MTRQKPTADERGAWAAGPRAVLGVALLHVRERRLGLRQLLAHGAGVALRVVRLSEEALPLHLLLRGPGREGRHRQGARKTRKAG